MSKNALYRITEARELRGMSVIDLADEIGVSKQTIYAYESGLSRPTSITLECISKTLQFPTSFFETPRTGATLENETIYFRSMARTLQKQRKQAKRWLQLVVDRVKYYEEFLNLPDVNLPRIDVDFRDLVSQDIEEIAASVRKQWGLSYAPISNVTLLLENNGFVISRANLASTELDACSVIAFGRPYILVNTAKETCSRMLMNLAHELGHLIMHGQVQEEDFESKDVLPTLEKQAWRFAGAFLMPESSFSAEATRVTLDHLVTLKARWRTSIRAMISRCRDIGIIDNTKATYLFRECSRKRYNTHEPLDDDLPVESPESLLLCDEVLEHEVGINKEEILFRSKLLSKDLCMITSAPDNYYEPQRPKLRLLSVGEA